MLPEEMSFPSACRQTLMAFILSMSYRLSRKRPADMFLNFLTNGASIFIVFLSELSNALMVTNSLDPNDAIRHYLEQHPESSLANVLDEKEQGKKLKAVSEDLIQTFLDENSYNCSPVRVFLVQTLSALILESVLKTCSKPEWINGWIVYLLEQGEPEIMHAINAGVGDAAAKKIIIAPSQRELSPARTADQPLIEHADSDYETRSVSPEVKRLGETIAVVDVSKTGSADELVSSTLSTETALTPTSSQSDLTASHHELVHDSSFTADSTNIASRSSQLATESIPFTSFDQFVSSERMETDLIKNQPLTLYNAKVSIFDDGLPGDRSTLRSKPTVDYLIQIEPASSQHAGWMIARRYSDFETLHEVLRRISVISGVTEFTRKFPFVPLWKGQTKAGLQNNLESYLHEALCHARLAESEGMKRFLEKDQGLEKLSNSRGILGFPSPETFQTMGKGMLDVLASAPKGAAGSGKAFLEGVRGVGGVFGGPKKANLTPVARVNCQTPKDTISRASAEGRLSMNGSRSSTENDEFPGGKPFETSMPPVGIFEESTTQPLPRQLPKDVLERRNTFGTPVRSEQQTSKPYNQISGGIGTENIGESGTKDACNRPISLPPRPSEINDAEDYVSEVNHSSAYQSSQEDFVAPVHWTAKTTVDGNDSRFIKLQSNDSAGSKVTKKSSSPLTIEETQVAVELIFAVINELYTLSSAWNIRKTLLNAAKTFLLRPGNPNLEEIRSLLQEQVIDANTTDTGLAAQIRKLRENGLPTEDELAQWPPPPSLEEQEKLRIKARKLLVEQGLPPALRSVMGAAASGEALGHLFDAIQIEQVSRALMFAVMLQGIKAVTH